MDQLKEHPQADRHKFKKMLPKVTGHRNREEVREDTIAEMKMEDLQGVLKEDVDLIFDALVLHDYIEELLHDLVWDGMTWCGKPHPHTISSPQNLQEFHHFASCSDVKLLQNTCY